MRRMLRSDMEEQPRESWNSPGQRYRSSPAPVFDDRYSLVEFKGASEARSRSRSVFINSSVDLT